MAARCFTSDATKAALAIATLLAAARPAAAEPSSSFSPASRQAAPQAVDPPRAFAPPDAFGNVVPDFSLAGYRHGGVPLPNARVVETLRPGKDKDDSARIQAAIDRVARLRPGNDGIRGAVLLTKGAWRCGTTLRVPPGVVLRGQGQDADGTVITATMSGAEDHKSTLIHVEGSGGITATGMPRRVLDEAVPLGAKRMKIEAASSLRPGDPVVVERPATKEWIHDLRMDRIRLRDSNGKQWSPSGYRLRWTATVTAVAGDMAELDTPVLCAIEKKYGGATVSKARDTRQAGAGIENLRLRSVYQKGRETSDEAHAWNAIRIDRVVDSWVRNVTALHFAYACVQVGDTAARVTVQDCAMIDPVSQITGGRRYSFGASGSFVLFQRCYARNGRHDFVTGQADLGPTVFLDCLAEQTHSDIGPHHRWSCGQLYDNVKGGDIAVQDRGGAGTGHGWAGNCQVFWNCVATKSILCQKPWLPSTQNWMIGCTGAAGKPMQSGRPDGMKLHHGSPVAPRSLYLAQLAARFDRAGGNGQAAVRAVTTVEQRQGTVWEALRQRHGHAP